MLVLQPQPSERAHGKGLPSHPPIETQPERQQLIRAAEASRGLPVELIPVRLRFPNLVDLRAALRLGGRVSAFPIVHLGTTMSDDGLTCFEDVTGREVWVSTRQLTQVFRGRGVRLVVLAVCRGERLAKALVRRAGVKVVVAFKGEFYEPEVASFTREFYERLALGGTIGEAFDYAQAALIRAYTRQELQPEEPLEPKQLADYAQKRAANLVLKGCPKTRLNRLAKPPTPLPDFLQPLLNKGFLPFGRGIYVSRAREEMTLVRWLREKKCRAIALCGIGGIGKSTLACNIAERCSAHFHRVLYFSARDRFDRHSDILDHLWRLMGASWEGEMPPKQGVSAEYKRQRLTALFNQHSHLLVLDNLESLTPDQTAELTTLLKLIHPESGTLALLTLRPEHFPPLVHRLEQEIRCLRIGGLEPADAVALLAEWAQRIDERLLAEGQPSIWTKIQTNDLAPAPADLLRALQSKTSAFQDVMRHRQVLPLLELARSAGFHPFLLLGAIHDLGRPEREWDNVEARLRLGEGKELHDLVDQWIGLMYDDLARISPESLAVLKALCAFAGGSSKVALRSVWKLGLGPLGESSNAGFDEAVQQATGASLLDFSPEAQRFQLHPLVRQYLSRPEITRPLEQSRWQRAHAKYFVKYVNRFHHDHSALENEQSNIFASVLDAGPTLSMEEQVAIACNLYPFMLLRGFWSEGRRLFAKAAQAARARKSSLHYPRMRYGLGYFTRLLGDHAAARSHLEASLELALEGGDLNLAAAVQRELGTLSWLEGKYPQALYWLKEAHKHYRSQQDTDELACTVHLIGVVRRGMGKLLSASRDFQWALRLAEDTGDLLGQAKILHDLAVLMRIGRRFAEAKQYLRQSLELKNRLHDRQGRAWSLLERGGLSHIEGNLNRALSDTEESLHISLELGDKFTQGRTLSELGSILMDLQQYGAARDRLYQAMALQGDINDVRGKCVTLYKLAELERELDHVDIAITFHQQGLDLAEQSGMPFWRGINCLGLGKCARQKGDNVQAQIHFEAVVLLAKYMNFSELLCLVIPELERLHPGQSADLDLASAESPAPRSQPSPAPKPSRPGKSSTQKAPSGKTARASRQAKPPAKASPGQAKRKTSSKSKTRPPRNLRRRSPGSNAKDFSD